MQGAVAKNMKLLSHDTMRGFGGVGEGMSLQIANDGRRILWIAHEWAPKNFTGVDVSDPRAPRVICQTALPHNDMRSNSLETSGDILAVAYQVAKPGAKPAGVELFDISKPETPTSISFFDASGPHSRGMHCLWFVDGEYIHCSGGAADFEPTHFRDDQFYRIIDVRNPSRPVESGRWWYPGTRKGDAAAPPKRVRPMPMDDIRGPDAFRLHNANVYPERPDRAYLGYIDGGAFIMDISDKSKPKVVGTWNPHPPYPGFTHTVMPLLDRGLKAKIGRSSPGWWTRARRTISFPSARFRCRRWKNSATRADASDRTISTKIVPAPRSAARITSSAYFSMPASASSTSGTRTGPKRPPFSFRRCRRNPASRRRK